VLKSAIMLENGNLFQPRDWKTIELEAHERMGDGVSLNLCSVFVESLNDQLPDDIKKRLPCGKKFDVCFKEMAPEEKVFVNKQ
jgi:hypothetical protein